MRADSKIIKTVVMIRC